MKLAFSKFRITAKYPFGNELVDIFMKAECD